MKRKSILILIAVLVLAISIPVFALAQSETAVQALDGTGNMYGRSETEVQQGSRQMLKDCDGDCDGDCEAQGTGLGAGFEALHQNARSASCLSDQNGSGTGNANSENAAKSGRGRHWAE